jgi:hypothetical protein
MDGTYLYSICSVLALIGSSAMMWLSIHMYDHKYHNALRIIPFAVLVVFAFVLPTMLNVNSAYDMLTVWQKLLGFLAGMLSLIGGLLTLVLIFDHEETIDFDSMH